MGRSRVRTLLMASITIMLCMALLVGGTYALWSDKVEVSNHLQAGTLKVKLVRTDLEQWRVDERGIVSKVTISDDDKKADFTHDTVSKDASKYEKNVFGMDDNELIAPTSKYSATMRIEKTDKTNIAFDYNVYIRLSADGKTGANLARQIKITVSKDGKDVVSYLSDKDYSATGDGYPVASGKVLTNATKTQAEFVVTVEFINVVTPDDTNDDIHDNDNNLAQTEEASFDLFVIATQATSA